MSLESGTYHIFSKIDNAPVGRNVIEDKSLLPKAVYKLPEGIQPPQVRTVCPLPLFCHHL